MFLSKPRHPYVRTFPFDELVAVAYVAGKTRKQIDGLRAAIIWALIRYTFMPLDRNARSKGKFPLLKDIRFAYRTITTATPAWLAEQSDQTEKLIKSVSKLELHERNLVYWYYRDSMTFAQIGARLCCSDRWASKMLKDVLKKLRRELGEDDA
jgi:RNA polymerase sigma factor (sigma-70 family)